MKTALRTGSSPTTLVSPAVEIRDVDFTYRDGDGPALRAARLNQQRGEMIGIMGRSGAGKSTLAKCLNAIVPGFEKGRFAGVVQIYGRNLEGARVCEIAPTVGMVFQDFEAQLFSTNVAHEVAFAMEQIGLAPKLIRARMGPALAAVGLSGKEDRDPTSLSGGEKQRLALASVLALQPEVIVLDEPTTDLDPEGRQEVFQLVRQLRGEGLSILIVEHETEEMRECDRLILMHDGEIIAEGPPSEVLARLDLLELCGVRPAAIDRVLAELGVSGHARNIDEAHAAIVRRLPHLAELRPQIAADQWPDRGRAPSIVSQSSSRASVNDTALINVEGLTHVYGGATRALADIDLTIEAGEFVAIIGQNGSGKTTMAKHLVGLLKPTAGIIRLGGRPIEQMLPVEIAAHAGYVFQNPDHQIFASTVEEEVAYGPRNFGFEPEEIRKRCERVLRAVGLEELRGKDPFLLGRGERQRLAVASILVLEPKLLILDEPTTGLDYPQQRRMMELICELNSAGTAIIVITHTPWLVAEYARRAILIRKGRKLFDGAVRDLFAQEELLTGASFRVPEVTALGRRFGILALTVDELVTGLRSRA